MSFRTWILVLLLSCLGLCGAAADTPVAPGATFETFSVGPVTYGHVRVLSVNARTLVIRHDGGMASIRLRDLSPEWQARFHYDPAAEAAAEQSLQAAPKPAVGPPRVATRKGPAPLEALLQQFGKPAEIRAEVDLRPKFFELHLAVKDQGYRPSCAVFAVVSALEFQNAELSGKAEKFSEEYLIWAVRQTTQHLPGASDPTEAVAEDKDEGFTLSEVVSALRAYGIPLQSSMPNTFGSKINAIENPPATIVNEARNHQRTPHPCPRKTSASKTRPATIVNEARNHQRVFVHAVPGRDAPTRINNVVLALNAGLPVPIGVAWPNYRSMRTGFLSAQKPMT